MVFRSTRYCVYERISGHGDGYADCVFRERGGRDPRIAAPVHGYADPFAVPVHDRRIVSLRGGGTRGNLPENAIDIMNASLAYISRASNLSRALGGRDQESLEELIQRALDGTEIIRV